MTGLNLFRNDEAGIPAVVRWSGVYVVLARLGLGLGGLALEDEAAPAVRLH